MTDTTDTSPEAVERPLDEVYDTQRDVEQDPCGAWQAIQALSAERDALKAENARLEAWQYAAFMVHSNLDLDIEGHPEARAAIAKTTEDKQ